MPDLTEDLHESLLRHAPFDLLPPEVEADLSRDIRRVTLEMGEILFAEGKPLDGLYVLEEGAIDIEGAGSDLVSRRRPGDVMGERGLLRDGNAMLTARAVEPSTLILLSRDLFHKLVDEYPAFADWFVRSAPKPPGSDDGPYSTGLTALQVSELMTPSPITCPMGHTITQVARMMRDNRISSVVVMDGPELAGIITARDLTNKVLAEGLTGDTKVEDVMSRSPITVAPSALGLDAMMMLADHGISHLPVTEHGEIIGLIGKTDLFRQQATTASHMISEIVHASTPDEMAEVMTRVPHLLAHLVSAGTRPDSVSRRITDLTDAITRRLLKLGEEKLGPPPVPYLWLACGSQGRREQTGVSDQDNCLILDDAAKPEDDKYFAALAKFVSDGLNTCGYVYCPGDMMATNPRWRQPRRKWREYFDGWIAQPDPEAQMLSSVMFDLRPIGGERELFGSLHRDTLERARKNSIFVAHMVSNSLKHTPPLSLFRNFALIRSGEHKNMLDLKLSGVVPVVDLARIYALQGALEPVNTRERLELARDEKVVSQSGAHDLIDAYELIAETRLHHQAEQIRRGQKPDNFMAPGQLSELERSHLRDAFMVIKTMQSFLGHGRSTLG